MLKTDEMRRILPELLRSLADELDRNPELANGVISRRRKLAVKRVREKVTPGFDPFEVLRTGGDSGLRERLESLDMTGLKTLISMNALDTTRLAQKWRNKQRLVSFILERIAARAQKGEVFMAS